MEASGGTYVVEAGGEEDTEGDEELVRADQGSSDPGRGGLGLEHRDDETEGADSKASDQATNHDLLPRSFSSDLDNETDGSNDAPKRDGQPAAEAVGNGSRDESADESTDGEEADDQAGADSAESGGSIGGFALAEALEEVGHLKEAGHLTGIVSEATGVRKAGYCRVRRHLHHAAHGNEDTHSPGAPRDALEGGVVEVGEVLAGIAGLLGGRVVFVELDRREPHVGRRYDCVELFVGGDVAWKCRW